MELNSVSPENSDIASVSGRMESVGVKREREKKIPMMILGDLFMWEISRMMYVKSIIRQI